jgi:hypothetical protein
MRVLGRCGRRRRARCGLEVPWQKRLARRDPPSTHPRARRSRDAVGAASSSAPALARASAARAHPLRNAPHDIDRQYCEPRMGVPRNRSRYHRHARRGTARASALAQGASTKNSEVRPSSEGPGAFTAGLSVEGDLVLESIHGLPETGVLQRRKLASGDQALEGCSTSSSPSSITSRPPGAGEESAIDQNSNPRSGRNR